MIRLLLAPAYQGPFLTALSRYAQPPVEVNPLPGGLLLYGAEPTDVAAALTLGAFPCYEQELLKKLLRKHFSAFRKEEQQLMCSLAPRIIARLPEEDALYSGYRRPLRLAREMARLLVGGLLDFGGFCRFRLSGHEEFLHYVLTLAADELLSMEEDETYTQLLQKAAADRRKPGKELHLFFCPQHICRIWERTESGIRDKEGGSYLGAEATLVSNVIAMQPSRLVIHERQLADPEVLRHLEQAFGAAMVDAPPADGGSAGG